jgi:cell division protein FtsB
MRTKDTPAQGSAGMGQAAVSGTTSGVNKKPPLKPGGLIKTKLWIALFGAACVILAGSLLRATLLYQSTTAKADQLRAELAIEQAEKNRLTRERDYMTSDTYIERAARIEYGFIYPGDIRFVAALEPADNPYGQYPSPDPGYYDEAGDLVAEAWSPLDDSIFGDTISYE